MRLKDLYYLVFLFCFYSTICECTYTEEKTSFCQFITNVLEALPYVYNTKYLQQLLSISTTQKHYKASVSAEYTRSSKVRLNFGFGFIMFQLFHCRITAHKNSEH